MIAREEEEEEAQAASMRSGPAGSSIPDSHRKGKWFSNPQEGVKLLKKPGGSNGKVRAIEVGDGGKRSLESAAVARDIEGCKKAKQSELTEFDAW
jgi:hypothetical protein